MTPEVSYLIDVQESKASEKWATPSLAHLRQLMRAVFTDRTAAKQKGEAARQHIIQGFSQESVAQLIAAEVSRISKQLAHGSEHNNKARKQE
jgi:hypothetical protein